MYFCLPSFLVYITKRRDCRKREGNKDDAGIGVDLHECPMILNSLPPSAKLCVEPLKGSQFSLLKAEGPTSVVGKHTVSFVDICNTGVEIAGDKS